MQTLEGNHSSSIAYDHVAVIGAGAWGTALALVAAQAGREVSLWAREPEVAQAVRDQRENVRFLPGVDLPPSISATNRLEDTQSCAAFLVAAPAQHVRETLHRIGHQALSSKPVMLCAKGIERGTGKLLNEILEENDARWPAILSGPSFARDVAHRLPTAVTIAAQEDIARRLQATLGHPTFRPYVSDDIAGVALGGAAKNVYAIGCGIVAGLGLGESARAGLLARSFAELCRLARAMDAREETLMGLSGLGDLVLTATSPTSRNFSFGLALGKGAMIGELLAPGRPLAEGVETAPALVARAARHDVELPVAEAVAAILSGQLAPDAAVPHLMLRPHRSE
ncbi:MAG: NAD(P)H-dependent glycerol-3-phosphate dehydrogenase [Rhizomicrobium sp.]|jgi:glycerol-3-phosphate dehydrogenase (NAD(P)+)